MKVWQHQYFDEKGTRRLIIAVAKTKAEAIFALNEHLGLGNGDFAARLKSRDVQEVNTRKAGVYPNDEYHEKVLSRSIFDAQE